MQDNNFDFSKAMKETLTLSPNCSKCLKLVTQYKDLQKFMNEKEKYFLCQIDNQVGENIQIQA